MNSWRFFQIIDTCDVGVLQGYAHFRFIDEHFHEVSFSQMRQNAFNDHQVFKAAVGIGFGFKNSAIPPVAILSTR